MNTRGPLTRRAAPLKGRKYGLPAAPVQDFRCLHCGRPIPSGKHLSGVINRNHCPYCLWSRHLDLFQPGDRLAACKGGMMPVALTLKATRKKYGPSGSGELMVVHRCTACGKIDLNRVAGDDDPVLLLELLGAERAGGRLPAGEGITLLSEADAAAVRRILFGSYERIPAGEW